MLDDHNIRSDGNSAAPTRAPADRKDDGDGENPNVRRHVLTLADGWEIDVIDLVCPSAENVENLGVTVLVGHAMMVDRRTVYRPDRPCLATTLARRGFRVLVPDLRGHGQSGPQPRQGGDYSYHDIVRDSGELIAWSRQLAPASRLAVVGHSLFGHTTMAFLAGQSSPNAGPARIDALVTLAVNMWSREFEPVWWRWALKRAAISTVWLITRAVGRLPSRAFRFGTADEAFSYWADYFRWAITGRWASPAGHDYAENFDQLEFPTLWIVSEGDRWMGNPRESLIFSKNLKDRHVIRLGHPSAPRALRQLAPNHMGLVVSPRSQPVWDFVATWLGNTLAPAVD